MRPADAYLDDVGHGDDVVDLTTRDARARVGSLTDHAAKKRVVTVDASPMRQVANDNASDTEPDELAAVVVDDDVEITATTRRGPSSGARAPPTTSFPAEDVVVDRCMELLTAMFADGDPAYLRRECAAHYADAAAPFRSASSLMAQVAHVRRPTVDELSGDIVGFIADKLVG